MKPNMKAAGANIAAERRRRNISQGTMAKILSVAQNTLSNWENGYTPIGLDKAWMIADELELPLDTLVGRTVPCNRQR